MMSRQDDLETAQRVALSAIQSHLGDDFREPEGDEQSQRFSLIDPPNLHPSGIMRPTIQQKVEQLKKNPQFIPSNIKIGNE